MFKLNQIVIVCMISLFATGCSNAFAKQSLETTQQQAQISEPIVAYFSKAAPEDPEASSEYSATPVKDGYYRKLIGRDKEGRYLVQDFYYDNNLKQTTPFWIKVPEGLYSFSSVYTDGTVTTFYKNGQPSSSSTYKDFQEIGVSKNYYPNGQLAYEYELKDAETYTYRMKFWYENGKPAIDGHATYTEEIPTFEAKAWDSSGQPITGDDAMNEIVDNIYEKIGEH